MEDTPFTPNEEDLKHLNNIWDNIDDEPALMEHRKTLINTLYRIYGGQAAAVDEAHKALKLDPQDEQLLAFLEQESKPESAQDVVRDYNNILHSSTAAQKAQKAAMENSKAQGKSKVSANVTELIEQSPQKYRAIFAVNKQRFSSITIPFNENEIPVPSTITDRANLEANLKTDVKKLQQEVVLLKQQMELVNDIRNSPLKELVAQVPEEKWASKDQLDHLEALHNNDYATKTFHYISSSGSSAVAINQAQNQDQAVEVFIQELEKLFIFLGEEELKLGLNSDAIRDLLVNRCYIVSAVVNRSLKDVVKISFMHFEHEHKKTYINKETLLGDDISSVPRDDFFLTDDGYGWSLEELVYAIQTNAGSCRNPLTKELLSLDDIRSLLNHPKGEVIRVAQLEQNKLCQGFREDTIERIAKLASSIIKDTSPEQLPGRIALDKFEAHVATLPAIEQEAVEKLRIHVSGSASFDVCIWETIKAAKNNTLCFQSAGDALKRAATSMKMRQLEEQPWWHDMPASGKRPNFAQN